MRIPRYGLPFCAVMCALALSAVLSPRALAFCAPATEHGVWQNHDRAADTVFRAEIVMHCQDILVNGEPWPPGDPWSVRVFEHCIGEICDWGEVGAVTLENRFIRAVYKRDFGETRVYLRMDPMSREMLYGYVYERFGQEAEGNYGRHFWFTKQDPRECTVNYTDPDWREALEGWFDCDLGQHPGQ